jgi:hypothetical protein
MRGVRLNRVAAVAGTTITLLLVALFGISYIVSTMFGFPVSLSLPLVVRVTGGLLVLAGLVVAGGTFRYRTPSDMAVSTYATLTKLFGRKPIAERLGRTEPLRARTF